MVKRKAAFGLVTRRRFLLAGVGAAAGVVGGVGYMRYIEPGWLRVDQVDVALGSSLISKPFRILHLSDLHWSKVVSLSFIDKSVQRGLGMKPDLIALTGDFVTRAADLDLDRYVPILKRLSDAGPCYAVLGNHDGGIWSARHGGHADTRAIRALLSAAGIEVLADASTKVTVRGNRLNLVGTTDLWSGPIAADRAFAGVDKGSAATVVLAHNPDTKNVIGDYPWHLMLCGHTHGGQLVIPFVGTPFAPVHDHAYVSGLKPWRDRQIYITRGVGNLKGVRLNCRPEVSVLDVS